MLSLVAEIGLALSVIAFGAFLYFALHLSAQRAAPQAQPHGAGAFAPQAALSDAAKLAEALAKLTDALAKAGPTIASLVASLFFFLMALFAAFGSGARSVL